MTNWHGNGGGWGGDAPVYDWDWPLMEDGGTDDKSYGLPTVWVTVQRDKPTERATGRDCIWHYTPEGDPEGWDALEFGARYYQEGMSCDRETEHEKRIMCFQAAELLYLHASKKGNPIADLNLGYVYSYDRCEGRYWDPHRADPTPLDKDELLRVIAESLERSQRGESTVPHLELAVKHYRAAAEADVAEACYKLGDLMRDGRGCEVDLREAFRWFMRAYELGRDEEPLVWGSAALRLGRAFEEGEGCKQSFKESCTWYERAVTGLGIAVREGEHWYRGALQHAEQGLARVRQELNGAY